MIHMRPIASARANPKIAYEKSCCFNDGLRAQANIKQPKTTPIPVPVRMKKRQTSLGKKKVEKMVALNFVIGQQDQ